MGLVAIYPTVKRFLCLQRFIGALTIRLGLQKQKIVRSPFSAAVQRRGNRGSRAGRTLTSGLSDWKLSQTPSKFLALKGKRSSFVKITEVGAKNKNKNNKGALYYEARKEKTRRQIIETFVTGRKKTSRTSAALYSERPVLQTSVELV